MPKKLALSEAEIKLVRGILAGFKFRFFVLGSRAIGNPKPFSDLDLYSPDEIPLEIVSKIREAFDESNLPFTVDLILKRDCSAEFLEKIRDQLIAV